MLFTEFRFAVFFAICLSVYWALKRTSHRHAFLLVMSYIFYAGWDVRFLALIAYSTAVTYVGSRLLVTAPTPRKRRSVLVGAITLQLASLFFFKYFDFAFDNLATLLSAAGLAGNWSVPDILLPVGISFFTFQAISYLVDVARGDSPMRRAPMDVALYIAFFPQLVAGPIVRSTDFMPQLDETKHLDTDQFIRGFTVFLLGFCYKAAIADNLGLLVDPVFADPRAWTVTSIWIATLGFHGQIYFDFAGYSWMAIGVAGMLGFALPRNFNFPYVARNVQEFWHRWHISLSTWLRDYVYIPLGGSRRGEARFVYALMVTMLLGGLWHGASWNFVLWGGLHGLALLGFRYRRQIPALGLLFRGAPTRFGSLAGLVLTQIWVFALWVPFRAESFDDTITIFMAMFGQLAPGENALPVWMLGVVVLPVIVDGLIGPRAEAWRARLTVSGFAYGAIMGAVFALILVLVPLSSEPFIYFRF